MERPALGVIPGMPSPIKSQLSINKGTLTISATVVVSSAAICALMCFCFRSEEHTAELQSPDHLVFRLMLEKKKMSKIKKVKGGTDGKNILIYNYSFTLIYSLT